MPFAKGVSILGPLRPGYDTVLTVAAQQFLADLHRQFESGRRTLLAEREKRQVELDQGKLPTFLKETEHVRKGSWTGPAIPKDLQDRRVEITGPVDRKMIINALNSGAKVFMADFEDSSAPTWDNLINGQINLRDAINGTIHLKSNNKEYKLKSSIATLMVRPRGWHLSEAHFLVDGDVMSGALFDFGLYFFHNAKNLISKGSGPYFYLPKLEGHREARLWNDVFNFSQKKLNIPIGTIRATVLIETILAAFEMDEIIYELRQHSAGLNCGRWDYIFSFIKKFRVHSKFVLPDRQQVTMAVPFMNNYVRLLIQTCHKRKVHAMGGMAAQIPVQNNPTANKAAFDKVRNDKLREVKLGHDGTWVAHPALIQVAMDVFNEHMKTSNQITNPGDSKPVTAAELLDLGPKGTITRDGLISNIDVGISYTESWLRGVGCAPIHNLMEDAATAEISRCQIWQWIKHSAKLHDGTPITKDLINKLINEQITTWKKDLSEDAYKARKFDLAVQLFGKMVTGDRLDDFLTLVAYPYITTTNQQKAKL